MGVEGRAMEMKGREVEGGGEEEGALARATLMMRQAC